MKNHTPLALLAGATIALLLPSLAAAQDHSCVAGECPSFDLAAGYTADLRRNTLGGVERGDAVSGLLKVDATWTTEALVPGAMVTTRASLIHTAGGDISGRYVGDLQGLNNIEADGALRLYEFWSEIRFGRGMNTRLGFLDLNAEFDAPVTSAFFIGPPFGIGTDLAQTGENGPAVFPVTSLGVRVEGRSEAGLKWRVAAFDGVPGQPGRRQFTTVDLSREQGALLIGEIEKTPRGFNKLALGAWTYTGRFDRIDAGASGDARRLKGNRGAYAVVDRPLGELRGVRFDGMVRAGFATGRFNDTSRYLGAAMVASHLMDSRPDDAIGLAVANARTSSAFRTQMSFDGGAPRASETQFELTWRSPLTDWVAVVPSAQWINRPGADGALDDSLVIGVRFEFGLGHNWPLLAKQVDPASDSALAQSEP